MNYLFINGLHASGTANLLIYRQIPTVTFCTTGTATPACATWSRITCFRLSPCLRWSRRRINVFEAVHLAKASVFRALRPLRRDDLVRGQYVGYRAEKGVAADSDVETFCAVRLFIDTWRWAKVPWYLRAGKLLPTNSLEVLCSATARTPATVVRRFGPDPGRANNVRFKLQPVSSNALAARVKHPGKQFIGDQRELYLCDDAPDEESPYERLLGDAMAGDGALFASQDALEAAWAVVDPVLADHHPALVYQPRTWGPTAADALFGGDGGWHNPEHGAGAMRAPI